MEKVPMGNAIYQFHQLNLSFYLTCNLFHYRFIDYRTKPSISISKAPSTTRTTWTPSPRASPNLRMLELELELEGRTTSRSMSRTREDPIRSGMKFFNYMTDNAIRPESRLTHTHTDTPQCNIYINKQSNAIHS